MKKRLWIYLSLIVAVSVGAGPTRLWQGVAIAESRTWKVGDKVEAWNIAWYKATILEIGSGQYAGYYKVHYDDFSSASDQWLKADSVRARPGASATTTGKAAATAKTSGKNAARKGGASAPRLGKYLIYSYGAGGNPLFLGHFELMSGGRYRASRRSSGGYYGSGRYAFDAKTRSIKWLSGPYLRDKWTGKFSVTREGKTHRIEMRPRTIATNSTDSQY